MCHPLTPVRTGTGLRYNFMERFLELHRKIRSKLCKEVFCHTMAVIVFSGLIIISLVEVLKDKNSNGKKLMASVLGICHFGLCATAILHLKWMGVMELNLLKCKVWIYLEVYNIAATTTFIVVATRYLLPPPFHDWTGTALLLMIYWLPLIMYKTSQVCRMLEFISILAYLHENSMNPGQKNTCGHNDGNVMIHNEPQRTTRTKNCSPSALSSDPTLSLSKPLSSSSPHIPFEWALMDSISNALP